MSKITETRIGKICAKHPELLGKRLASNGNCIQCARDAAAKQHAARTMTVGQEITTLRGQLHKLQMENKALLDALKGMASMYGFCWDLVDGGLICMQSNVQRFEDAHEEAQKVIASVSHGS